MRVEILFCGVWGAETPICVHVDWAFCPTPSRFSIPIGLVTSLFYLNEVHFRYIRNLIVTLFLILKFKNNLSKSWVIFDIKFDVILLYVFFFSF